MTLANSLDAARAADEEAYGVPTSEFATSLRYPGSAGKTPRQQSWLRALAEAAKEQGVPLPSFTGHGMGSARSVKVGDGRFITFKRRLVPAAQAEVDGVEWTLWREQDDLPVPVAAFREPMEPKPESVTTALALLKGWLVDGWTPEEAQAAVRTHHRLSGRDPEMGTCKTSK